MIIEVFSDLNDSMILLIIGRFPCVIVISDHANGFINIS